MAEEKKEASLPDFAYKMVESIVNLPPKSAIRIKLNSLRFSLFRTCYVTSDEDTANKLFLNSFIIPGLDWVSVRCYYQENEVPNILSTKEHPIHRLPEEVAATYLKKVEQTFTVIPYYTVNHEGCVDESKDRRKFNTAIHQHFVERRVLMASNKESQTRMLDIIFKQVAQMRLVMNGVPHKSVCQFCENYFRAVAGMCHFRKSEKDGTLVKDNPGRLLCGMRLLYNSDLDDLPEAVPAPYQVNLLKELSTVDETQ